MKRKFLILVAAVACVITCAFGLVACGNNHSDEEKNGDEDEATLISVDGANFDEQKMSVFMLVDKDVESVSLSKKVVCSENCVWKLYYDKMGQSEIPTKLAADKSGVLKNGDNIFYIVVTSSTGSQVNVYELNVYRSYRVAVNYYDNKQTLLRTDNAYTGYDYEINYTPDIVGYTFNFWQDKNGKKVTSVNCKNALNFFANCTAETFTVTLNENGGAALDNNEKTVTYDQSFSLPVATRTLYTFTGWYLNGTQITDANGIGLKTWTHTENSTLTAGWQINKYPVAATPNDSAAGTVKVYGSSGTSSNGTYDYNSKVTLSAMTNIGYIWLGWFDGEKEITKDLNYSFEVPAKAVGFTAKWALREEMNNLEFNSTQTSCVVTGVKRKTVTEITVPDYVTQIRAGAFNGCAFITSITLPFVGGSLKTENHTYQYPFGYIFGTSSYNGSVAVEQSYYGSSLNSTKSTIYYVPERLTSVTVTGGNLLYGAFYGCDKLTDVSLPDGLNNIGNSAFGWCSSLTSITIPDSVTSIGDNAFYACISLENLIIPVSVTSIGLNAFCVCKSLESITVPNGVKNIAYGTFSDCISLTNVSLPDSVNSIGDAAFERCTSLENITIPDSVKSIGKEVFSDCSSLVSITIPDGVTGIGDYTFYNCSLLTSISLPDTVTSIGGGAFSNCNSLKSINLPEVKSISNYMFSDCGSLTSINIPDSVTSIGNYAFKECSSLTSVLIPKGVKSIGAYAFSYCSLLTTITIPESVIRTGNDIFVSCKSLTIYCDVAEKPSGWDSSWNFFACPVVWNCKNNDKDENGYIYDIIDGIRYKLKDGKATVIRQLIRIKTATIYEKVTYKNVEYTVTSISEKAFYDCDSLTSITIPDSVTSIGRYAFNGCSSLNSIIIPDSVTNIGSNAFYDCESLESISVDENNTVYVSYDGILYNKAKTEFIHIPNAIKGSITIPDSITGINSNTFRSCGSLESITVSENNALYSSYEGILYNKAKTEIMLVPKGIKSVSFPDSITSIRDYAFSDCGLFTSLIIPDNIKSIGFQAFYNCSSLTNVIISDSVTSIDGNVFIGCVSLTSITVESSNKNFKSIDGNLYSKDGKTLLLYAIGKTAKSFTIPNSVTSIGNSAFRDCSSLTSIIIPDSVTSIGDYAFSDCGSLISLIIPDNITSIGFRVFYNCCSLTSITIPDNITSIGGSAFENCRSLKDINFNGTKNQWNAIEKSNSWNDTTGDYTVHCTDGDIAKN